MMNLTIRFTRDRKHNISAYVVDKSIQFKFMCSQMGYSGYWRAICYNLV